MLTVSVSVTYCTLVVQAWTVGGSSGFDVSYPGVLGLGFLMKSHSRNAESIIPIAVNTLGNYFFLWYAQVGVLNVLDCCK